MFNSAISIFCKDNKRKLEKIIANNKTNIITVTKVLRLC